MNIISAIAHNEAFIISAEKTINSLIRKDCKVWLTDEDGNVFIPKGEIKIGYYHIMEDETNG